MTRNYPLIVFNSIALIFEAYVLGYLKSIGDPIPLLSALLVFICVGINLVKLYIDPVKHSENISNSHLKPLRLTEYELSMINEWYETKVAKHEGTQQKAKDLYDWVAPNGLKKFLAKEATENVKISQKDMEQFLTEKGHLSYKVCGELIFYGICTVLYGNVRTNNYGT